MTEHEQQQLIGALIEQHQRANKILHLLATKVGELRGPLVLLLDAIQSTRPLPDHVTPWPRVEDMDRLVNDYREAYRLREETAARLTGLGLSGYLPR